MPDQRDRPSRVDRQLDRLEHRTSRDVREGDVLEADDAVAGREVDRVLRVLDLLRLVHHLEDALAGGGRALRLPDPHAEHPQRHDEHRQEQVEGDEVADRHLAVDDLVAAVQEHRRLREQRDERDQRHVEGALPVREDALSEDRLRPHLELRLLRRLLRERLDDVDADDVLLGDGGDVGHLLLDVAQDRVRDVAVAVRQPDEDRGDREPDQRELPVENEHDHGHAQRA